MLLASKSWVQGRLNVVLNPRICAKPRLTPHDRPHAVLIRRIWSANPRLNASVLRNRVGRELRLLTLHGHPHVVLIRRLWSANPRLKASVLRSWEMKLREGRELRRRMGNLKPRVLRSLGINLRGGDRIEAS